MSPTELDLPLQPSAEQIRRRQFATVRRGYDPDQVRDYLQQLADQVEVLESHLRDARLEAEAASRVSAPTPAPAPATPKPDPYGELSSRLSELIRAADQQAETIRREAREEAERILAEARADADRIRLDAQSKAEDARASGSRALADARAEADRLLTGLAARKESLVEQLQAMQERLLKVANELEATIVEPANGEAAARAAVDARDEAVALGEAASTSAEDPRARDRSEAILDPRYEDLWSSETVDLTLPDLPTLDLDLDDDGEPGEGGDSGRG